MTFSRYSFFGIHPNKVLKFKKGRLYSVSGSKKTEIDMNPIDYLNNEISNFKGYTDKIFGDFAEAMWGILDMRWQIILDF